MQPAWPRYTHNAEQKRNCTFIFCSTLPRRRLHRQHESRTAHSTQCTRGSGASYLRINPTAARGFDPEHRAVSSLGGAEERTRRVSGSQWAQSKRLSGWRWRATHYFLLHHHTVAYSWVLDGLPLHSHTLMHRLVSAVCVVKKRCVQSQSAQLPCKVLLTGT